MNINDEIEGGIDLERLINKDYLTPLGDFYQCSICSKIMINPTDCESCGHSFCHECISKSNCPFGCKEKNFWKVKKNGCQKKIFIECLGFVLHLLNLFLVL